MRGAELQVVPQTVAVVQRAAQPQRKGMRPQLAEPQQVYAVAMEQPLAEVVQRLREPQAR
jgi:hypothetical protein